MESDVEVPLPHLDNGAKAMMAPTNGSHITRYHDQRKFQYQHRRFGLSHHGLSPTHTYSIYIIMTVPSPPPGRIPDQLDDDRTTRLSSFSFLRQKTLDLLYNARGQDKSPKGHVDAPIRQLVDTINAHPCFATLSSCSGRISVFDPHGHNDNNQNSNNDDGEKASHVVAENASIADDTEPEQSSGKGHGRWLLVSHETIDPNSLASTMDFVQRQTMASHSQGSFRNNKDHKEAANHDMDDSVVFKMEPMLLHVAASTLSRGKQLLGLALRLGFRESGLIVTDTRITVAIRSYSLALSVPIAREGPLLPSNEYLYALCRHANEKLNQNMTKLQKLQGGIEEGLFEEGEPKLLAQISRLPDLNLWRHAAVYLSEQGQIDKTLDSGGSSQSDGGGLYVFGGYGSGPSNVGGGQPGPCKRSDRIYRLGYRKRTKGSVPDPRWTVIDQAAMPDRCTTRIHGVPCERAFLSAREGLKACTLSLGITDCAVVFGGRTSPMKPYNDTFLYDPFCSGQDSLWKALDIRGEPPEPRWGHTQVATKRDILVIGGRDGTTALDSIHVLTVIRGGPDKSQGLNQSKNQQNHLLWTRLECGLPTPVFDHVCLSYDNNEGWDETRLFGGMSVTKDLLGGFPNNKNRRSNGRSSSGGGMMMFSRYQRRVLLEDPGKQKGPPIQNLLHRAGGAGCILCDPRDGSSPISLLCGGTSALHNEKRQQSDSQPMLVWFQRKQTTSQRPKAKEGFESIEVVVDDHSRDGNIISGPLVHHECIPLPCQTEVLIVGGGVSSYSFGPSFSRYVTAMAMAMRAAASMLRFVIPFNYAHTHTFIYMQECTYARHDTLTDSVSPT